MKHLGLFLLVATVFGLGIWYEVSLWQECRVDHSWFYCLRVLSH
uniref:Uncharacterized protein n=1 Tax=Pseudomonas phage Ghual01 TaxID=3138534 RepID=A0AAU6VZX9_9CAUD